MSCCQCFGSCFSARWTQGILQFLAFCALVAQLGLSIYSTKERIDDVSTNLEFCKDNDDVNACPSSCDDLDDKFIEDLIRPIEGTVKGNFNSEVSSTFFLSQLQGLVLSLIANFVSR